MNPAGGMAAMVYQASTWVLPVVFAVTFHEAAHGFVAYQFGDDTAKRAGRVTFNPFKHVDPFGTIILPAMLILLRSPFPVRLCQAGAGQFPAARQAAARHGVGRSGRARHQRAARDCFVAADLRGCFGTAVGSHVAARQFGEFARHQRRSLRFQHVAFAASGRRQGRRGAAPRSRWPCRSRGSSVMAC